MSCTNMHRKVFYNFF